MNASMKFFLSFFFTFLFFKSFAQKDVEKYVILDIQTNTPIPYVSIFVSPNSYKSTISNVKGEFNIKSLEAQDTVSISCIGYITRYFTKSELDATPTIHLTPNIYKIEEVVITPYKARNLVEIAYAKVKSNFPEKYPILKGIYRQQTIEDTAYVLFAECNMEVVIPKFAKSQKVENTIPKIKYSNIKLSENKMTNKGTYNIMAKGPLVGYPEPYFYENINDFVWKIENSYKDDDEQMIYEISFKEKSQNNASKNGYIYIAQKDTAIIKLCWNRKHYDTKKENKNSFLHVFNSELSAILNYRKVDNKYQIDYSRMEWHYDIIYSNEEDTFQHKYIVVVDFLTQSSYSGKLSDAKNADILPFKDPKVFEQVDWNHFKTILPDYEN